MFLCVTPHACFNLVRRVCKNKFVNQSPRCAARIRIDSHRDSQGGLGSSGARAGAYAAAGVAYAPAVSSYVAPYSAQAYTPAVSKYVSTPAVSSYYATPAVSKVVSSPAYASSCINWSTAPQFDRLFSSNPLAI
uniref:Uncharacterized protein n=1 Tax=Anopheles coluzzii TaxID=1518534 RepID=A0A8W7PH04_ANOCL